MQSSADTLPDTFTTGVARRLGVHSRELYARRDAGEVVELSRGVFRRADAPAASWPDLLAVAYRAPRAIVCCVSAAMVHDLTDELPPAVQIAVPTPAHPPRITYPPTTVLRFDESTFELGLSALEAAPGELIRIYDSSRTVVDLLRLRHRLGDAIAYGALRRYLRRQDARPAQLLEHAGALGVRGRMSQALDIASA